MKLLDTAGILLHRESVLSTSAAPARRAEADALTLD
jgi:hypothetical protein